MEVFMLKELKRQGSWLLKAITTDVIKQATGYKKPKKKKKKPTIIFDHNGKQLYYIDRKGKKHKYK